MRQAHTGLHGHKTTGQSHTEAPEGHSSEETVGDSVTPVFSTQEGFSEEGTCV